MGAFWGGLWGLLFGAPAFLIIPGVGPVVAAGSIVAWIVAALEGAVVVGGLSAWAQDSSASAFPKQRRQIRDVDQSRQVRLVAHGPAAEGAKARDLLNTSGAEQIDSYEPATEAARVA